jgi:hypothetical protein
MRKKMRNAKCTHDFSWENPAGRESTELLCHRLIKWIFKEAGCGLSMRVTKGGFYKRRSIAIPAE